MNTSSELPTGYHNFRLIVMIIALIVAVLALIWTRAFYGSMKSFEEGEAFLAAGDRISAVTHFDRSLHWYTPFNPYVEKSARMLWEISRQAQKDGDMRLAIIAVKSLRRGFISARGFYVPGRDWIQRCDRRVSELLDLQQDGHKDKLRAGPPNRSILGDPQVTGPDVFWSTLVVCGLLGWIGSAIAFIVSGRRGDQQGKWLASFRGSWIISCLFFGVLWIVGMMKA